MDRAERRARDRGLGLGRDAGNAEIGDAGAPLAVHQDVPGLDVAMNDAARVRDREAVGDILRHPRGGRGRQRRLPADPRGQVVAVDQLHHEERRVAVGARAEIADDIRMVEDGRGMSLAPEAQGQIRVGDDLRAQQLHGHRPPEQRVPRPEDGGHPAPPDHLVEAEAAREHVPGFDHARTVSGIGKTRHESRPMFT
jgi:hypothetical protein